MISEVVLEKLEFEKIQLQISKYSITEGGKKHILNLFPVSDSDLLLNRDY